MQCTALSADLRRFEGCHASLAGSSSVMGGERLLRVLRTTLDYVSLDA